MSRKSVMVLAAVVAVVAVIGASAYFLLRKDYTLTCPDSWEKKTDYMGTDVIYLSPLEDSNDEFRENVNVIVEKLPSNMGLNQYVDISLKNAGKMLTDYRNLENSAVQLNGLDAQRIVSIYRMGDMRICALSYVIVKGRKAYTITCTALDSTYEKYKQQFEDICGTMKVR